MKVKIDKDGFKPTKAHRDDAGYDLYTPIDFDLNAGDSKVIDLGVHFQIPTGYCGFIKSRSGLNVKHRIRVCDGTIDAGFRGSVKVRITNAGSEDYHFKRGDRICQIVICLCSLFTLEEVPYLDDADDGRNDDGWGSSGR